MPPPENKGPDQSQGGASPNLIALVGTIAAAIGTLGWITFLGGALFWISFRQASLPSAEAVARVPTGVLVAAGAEFVVAAVLAVVAVVLVLFLLDDSLRRWIARDRIARARTLDDELTAQRNQGRSTLEAAEEQRKAAEAAQAALGTPGDPSHATSLEALNRASEEWIRAEEAASPIREALLKKADELEAAKTPTWHERARRYVVGGLVGVAALICAALVNIGQGPLPVLWGWVAVVIAALLASFVATTLYTASNEQRIESEERGTRPTWVARYRFPLVGLVVFIAIPIVMAVGVYFRAEDAPQVEPLAFLSGDGTPVVGFLIAETSDRLYYGTFESSVSCRPGRPGCPRHQTVDLETVAVPPRMVSVPTTDVQSLSVGPLLPLNAQDAQPTIRGRPRTAREWAGGTALILCHQAQQASARVHAPPSPAGTEGTAAVPPPPVCSEDDRSKLEDFVAAEQRAIRRELRSR